MTTALRHHDLIRLIEPPMHGRPEIMGPKEEANISPGRKEIVLGRQPCIRCVQLPGSWCCHSIASTFCKALSIEALRTYDVFIRVDTWLPGPHIKTLDSCRYSSILNRKDLFPRAAVHHRPMTAMRLDDNEESTRVICQGCKQPRPSHDGAQARSTSICR